MCGIVGVWSSQAITDRENGERRLADMVSRIAHRGPDGSGVWFDGTVGLGHARLAVIDLSEAAAQPMVDVEGVVRVTYNGEIYNYRELRQQLASLGHRFQSDSDTEVLLEGYKRWGINMLQRLQGMFAFALWDAGERRLFLVRDRIGKKPLYYAAHGETLVFASEIKAIISPFGEIAGRSWFPLKETKRSPLTWSNCPI